MATSTLLVLLVRHADIQVPRTLDDPPISPEGSLRAAELSRIVAVFTSCGLPLRALYASEATRTQETLEPVSRATGVAISVIDAADTNALKREIISHPDGIVVVAGHSNTIPLAIEVLGGPAGVMIRESDFDRLFTLAPVQTSLVNFAMLRYGTVKTAVS